jgi:hypothetical protein
VCDRLPSPGARTVTKVTERPAEMGVLDVHDKTLVPSIGRAGDTGDSTS